jgi:hypothetical protein
MAQAVGRRPLTAETRVRYRDSPYGICDRQSNTGTAFSPSSSVSPANIIPPFLHAHLLPPHEACDSPDQAIHD